MAHQELRIDLESFDGNRVHAQYSTFSVGNESSKYKVTVSGYSGTAGKSDITLLLLALVVVVLLLLLLSLILLINRVSSNNL